MHMDIPRRPCEGVRRLAAHAAVAATSPPQIPASRSMAQKGAARLTTNPHLLDIVDEEWLRDTLPVDSEWAGSRRSVAPLLTLVERTSSSPSSLRPRHARNKGQRRAAWVPPPQTTRAHWPCPAGVPLPRGVVGPSEDTDPVANDNKKLGAKGSTGQAWNELGMSLAAAQAQ